MKIVFDARVHLNYFSGISRYIICLLEAYLNQFQEDEVIVLLNPTIKLDNNIYKTLRPFSNVTFKVVDAGHMGPKNYLVMGKIIKQLAPDVYHYPHLDAPIFTGKIPVIATIHDTNSNKTIKKFDDRFGLKSLYFKKSLNSTLKRAAKVIFVSDSVKEEVLSDFKIKTNSKKYVRIYNGFEPGFNVITKNDTNQTLEKLDKSKPYILFVGQIREHKNIYRVIEAFKVFNNKHPTYQLVIVGHNYLQLDLNDTNIQHFDKVSNHTLKELYSGCTSFLFPSLFEGFGFPILEAFSFGKPVITSNYGATKEISGGLGILVDPTSVNDIANGISQSIVLDNDATKRINHTKTFSWNENAKNLRRLYMEAIEEG